ncbi:MAG: 2-phospho-L-lactate transferase [Nitrososphaera sp.]|nr:2-phospho-L-lactate transferase [Nitrososphaera sp.]
MIVILAGGTGSVKLVRGMAAITDDIAVISNVSDNIWLHGLYVCPDIDTITYSLAGMLDKKKGWGVSGDTFSGLEQMKKMGQESWFRLGDKDIALHIFRTELLKEGKSLSDVSDMVRRRLGIKAQIIPATDDSLQTMVLTDKGKMHLQEFWVREKGKPSVKSVSFEGLENAKASRIAIDAIRKAERIIVAPANPISSIGPIIALSEIRKEISKVKQKVVAVSPIIGRSAVSGPALKYMKAMEVENSPVGVARYYSDFLGTMIISKTDSRMASQIEKMGIRTLQTNIMMHNRKDEIRLARYLLK